MSGEQEIVTKHFLGRFGPLEVAIRIANVNRKMNFLRL